MWQQPEAGQLRERLTLENATRTDDSMGGWTLSWTQEGELWAKVRAKSSPEKALADGRTLTRTHEVIVRFSDAVQPDKRFIYRGQELRIVSVDDPNGKRAFLRCQCSYIEI